MRKLTHAEISRKRTPLASINSVPRLPVSVIVDNIRSLYNVGSIFRSSDGVRLSKLILSGFTPKPPRKEIEKTALGSTLSVPWEYLRDPVEAVIAQKLAGHKVYCLELTDNTIPYYTINHGDFPLCLVIGNEITGVSKEVIACCDHALEIPQHGIKQSLNVAVAYGIAIYHCSRVWRDFNSSEDQ
ncbi:MAG: RNA methyltransferase [bacterium]